MKMKSIARRHHFLPEAYLAQFTDNCTKGGKFFVLEVETGRSFRSKPKNVAVERDFNRVDIEGHSPDIFENALASTEDIAIRAIANTSNSRKFPSDQDYSAILNLISLIFVRNPFLRESFNQAREQSLRIAGELLVSDKSNWNHYVQKAKEDGINIPESVSFEKMKGFVQGGNYEIKFHPQENLCVEMQVFETVLNLLHARTWSLIIAPPDGPEFICSDHPVALNFKQNLRGPIGLETRRTELFFPLTRQAGFYSTFEDPLKEVVYAKPGNVASMNCRVALNAKRHVFSALGSFQIWFDGGIQTIDCGKNQLFKSSE